MYKSSRRRSVQIVKILSDSSTEQSVRKRTRDQVEDCFEKSTASPVRKQPTIETRPLTRPVALANNLNTNLNNNNNNQIKISTQTESEDAEDFMDSQLDHLFENMQPTDQMAGLLNEEDNVELKLDSDEEEAELAEQVEGEQDLFGTDFDFDNKSNEILNTPPTSAGSLNQINKNEEMQSFSTASGRTIKINEKYLARAKALIEENL